MREKSESIVFMDKRVPLHRNSAVFVTLNPAGKGYGGRSKLPSNLQQLFRGVSMTYPNHEHIAQVLFRVEGFRSGKLLGSKLVRFFEACRECLSAKRHYDWGLRSIRAVLSMAGRILQVSNFACQ